MCFTLFSFVTGYERIGEPFHQVLLNSGPDEVTYNIYGYRYSSFRLICYHFFSILLGGLPYIIFNLYSKYSIIKFEKCSLQIADFVLGKRESFVLYLTLHYFLLVSYGHGNYSLITIDSQNVVFPVVGTTKLRYFYFQHSKYVWDYNKCAFCALENFFPAQTLDEMLENEQGLTTMEQFNL